MNLVKVTHPNLDGVHEVPEQSLTHWGRVGWEPVAEAEQDTQGDAAADPPAPRTGSESEPSKTAPRRSRRQQQGE